MPDWLLDTNAVSALMRHHPQVAARLVEVSPDETIHISVVTNAEIRYGIRRMPVGRRRRSVEQAYELLLPRFGPGIEISLEVSETYAQIKATLESQGIILPENDLWIAATALVRDLTLVTNDRHFETVPALRVEDWSASDQGGAGQG